MKILNESKKYTYEINLRENLFSMRDRKYREFSLNLLPGVYDIIGVRIPILKDLAKKIASENWEDFFLYNKNDYFEEVMLEGLVIGYLEEDIIVLTRLINNFIPKIYNWSICDSFCSNLKVTNLYKEHMWNIILKNLKTTSTYRLRFSLVMILNYYVEKEYIDEAFTIFNNIAYGDYYVDMALAWAISYFYIEFKHETIDFLKENKLSPWVQNKSIQKIIESNRVSKSDKDKIKLLKS